MLEPLDPNDKTNLAPYRIVHLMALVDADDQMRSKLTSGVLHRHRPFVLRPRRNRAKPRLGLSPDFRWRRRCLADDDRCILPDMVQTTGSHSSFTCSTRRHRVTGSLALMWPATLAMVMVSLVGKKSADRISFQPSR